MTSIKRLSRSSLVFSALLFGACANPSSPIEVRFPSPVKSRFPANNTVWAQLYLPQGKERPPCVLVLPVMAAPNLWIETRFIRAFNRAGVAALLVEMPFQFHRVAAPLAPSGQAFLARSPKVLAANFRQGIADARAAYDWLIASGRVDNKRIGLFGISLGAMVGAAAMSQDPRLDNAIFLLGGADFATLLERSAMTKREFKRLGIKREDLAAAFKGLDPLDHKEGNAKKRVLLINAWQDHIVVADNARALKAAFPSSTQTWLPLGHYTSILHMFWLPRYVAKKWVQRLSP